MKKIRSGEYNYNGLLVKKRTMSAFGASPASISWGIYEDSEDLYAFESFNTKKDCKQYIDNMNEEI